MLLDESYTTDVRRAVPRITVARLAATTTVRFTAPLLATIARGYHVSLGTLGIAVSVSELVGLTMPFLGRLAESWPRRRTMLFGLGGLVCGALAAAATSGPVLFGAALMLIALSKNFFDIGTNSWVSDHVSYERRGRVIGITEVSWAGGLLVGVPLLLVAVAVTNWRGGYVLAAVLAAGCALLFIVPLPNERPSSTAEHASAGVLFTRAAVPTVVAIGLLMAASQSAFVTFGSWLHDRFSFSDGELAAVAFLLGAGELVASLSTSRMTDRWGKRRSVRRGAGLMVPAALALSLGLWHHLGLGVPVLMVFFIGFEFAIVSSISLASNLIPGRPAAGLSMAIAVGTLGRAVAPIPATLLYEHFGFPGPMLLAAAFAGACAVLIRTGAGADQP